MSFDIILVTFGKKQAVRMEGISYLTDEAGLRKAIVIDIALLRDRDNLVEIFEDIEDEIAIDLRKNEELLNWDDVRDALITED